MERICIFGAGAIGGYVAAKLGAAGRDVTIVARKPQVDAVAANGLRLITPTGEIHARVRATDDPSSLPRQDLVITTAKAHALPSAARDLATLSGPETAIVYVVNGIPWWYHHGRAAGGRGSTIERLDPGGHLWCDVGVGKAVGGVIYSSNEVIAPGVVRNTTADNRLILGEPSGEAGARLAGIVEWLRPAGTEATGDIRREVWRKLLGNMAGSPIGCLTRLPGNRLLADPALRDIYRALYAEGIATAAGVGVALDNDVEDRIRRMSGNPHRSSMLQDFEAGRPLEVDAQLLAVQDLAREAGVATPTLDLLVTLLLAAAAARPS